jgi:putative protease
MEALQLKKGDQILITGKTTGVIETTIEEIRVDNAQQKVVNKGDNFSIPLQETIRPGDKLYKVVDA